MTPPGLYHPTQADLPAFDDSSLTPSFASTSLTAMKQHWSELAGKFEELQGLLGGIGFVKARLLT